MSSGHRLIVKMNTHSVHAGLKRGPEFISIYPKNEGVGVEELNSFNAIIFHLPKKVFKYIFYVFVKILKCNYVMRK